jgi:hypothetical protein
MVGVRFRQFVHSGARIQPTRTHAVNVDGDVFVVQQKETEKLIAGKVGSDEQRGKRKIKKEPHLKHSFVDRFLLDNSIIIFCDGIWQIRGSVPVIYNITPSLLRIQQIHLPERSVPVLGTILHVFAWHRSLCVLSNGSLVRVHLFHIDECKCVPSTPDTTYQSKLTYGIMYILICAFNEKMELKIEFLMFFGSDGKKSTQLDPLQQARSAKHIFPLYLKPQPEQYI